ncbi:MAG: nuclear transport factor 2 family protein [Pseudomonadota bacterium]
MTAASDDPAATCLAFLDALGARDLDRAARHLASGVEMIFPGPTRMTTLPELIAWSKDRYATIAKTVDGTDVAGGTVYVRGTLSGTWPDGTAFAGIRFIDRFEVEGGLIRRQDVWNDLAEAKARRA